MLHALLSKQASCVRRIQFVWIVKAGKEFEWFAQEIEQALEAAEKRGIQLDVRGYVTCEPSYTTNFPVRHVSQQKETKDGEGCCCCSQVEDTPTPEIEESSSTGSNSITITEVVQPSADEKVTTDEKGTTDEKAATNEKLATTDEISIVSDSSSEQFCKCNCSAGGDESPITVSTGRPDLRAILDRNLSLARGETGVAVCGPQGLMARTRCVVAALSDERGSEKGTGAHGVSLFGEGFGW
jgi:ferric-chelate reductase